MDCCLPGSSVHGIFQGKVLECVAISSSEESSQPGDQIQVSCIFCTTDRFFTAGPPRDGQYGKIWMDCRFSRADSKDGKRKVCYVLASQEFLVSFFFFFPILVKQRHEGISSRSSRRWNIAGGYISKGEVLREPYISLLLSRAMCWEWHSEGIRYAFWLQRKNSENQDLHIFTFVIKKCREDFHQKINSLAFRIDSHASSSHAFILIFLSFLSFLCILFPKSSFVSKAMENTPFQLNSC